MPSHPDRVRRNYDCRLCGTSTLVGQHAIYEFDAERMEMVICRPVLMCHYPSAAATIRSIEASPAVTN